MSGIEVCEFAPEDIEGPSIGGDVVDGEQEDVLVVIGADEGGAKESVRGEVERLVGLDASESVGLLEA
jgi:hypothetical protein